MLATGTQFGPYKILGLLGAGGMGEVYRARDLRLGREVALKVLPEHLAKDLRLQGRFAREARALAALSHPNILTVYDVSADAEPGRPCYLVTELLQGETLRACLRRSPFSWNRAAEIGIAAAEGLAAAHARGVIHRDLKPENLFLTSDGGLKILDFGLARLEQPVSSEDLQSLFTMPTAETELGTLMGTVGYMAPEQVRGEAVDARSDLFSLGCVLYEMVSGKRPFARSKPGETLAAILSAEPLPLSGVPGPLEQLIRRCLQKQPERRYASARDLAEALRMAGKGGARTGMLSRVAAFFARIFAPRQPEPAPSTLTATLSADRPIDSLAVLPLVNAGADPEMDYLSDGITESIIGMLSQIPQLRVMARSTVFRFKGKDLDPREVGRKLNVRAVLTGRLLRPGNRVLIKAELVDVADGAQLWSGQYNREFGEVFDVEEALAREIAEKLRLRLSGEQEQRLARRYTDNVEAYQLYLKGLYHWNRRTEEGLKKAIQFFERALAIDPAYALAYAGLADCFNLPHFGALAPQEAYPRAKAAAAKALEIDENLAEAHVALAFAQFAFDWDWGAAESGFQRAIELNPNYARAHHASSSYLLVMGRFDEALTEAKQAVQLDPLSLIINHHLGLVHFHARRYDQAIEQYQKTLELDAQFAWARCALGLAYGQKGMYPEAIAALEEAWHLDENPVVLAGLGYTLARSGERQKALNVLDRLQQLSKKRHVAPYDMATIYAGLGDPEQAFRWLEKAYAERGLWVPFLGVDPMFDSLRSDPRLDDLLRRLGLRHAVVNDDRPIDSLAILPLVNAGDDPEMEFLSDGITESIMNQLARLPRLRVMSRNSVFRYKGKEIDAREVGRTLGVQGVLTGRVISRGDALSVSVELIKTQDDTHLWGERYDRKLADLLAVQEEIAGDVVEQLRLRLSVSDQRRLGRRHTDNVEAYQLYLKGRYYWNKRTDEGLKKSIGLFQQAIDKDPTYALAYAGLADTYLNLGGWGQLPPHDAYPKAKAAAARALEIDDTLAAAHNSLAMVSKEYDWDVACAERLYRRAIELDPNYAVAHMWYAECLAALHRHSEAIAEFQRALELDPLSLIINAALGRHGYFFARRYDEAIEQLRKTIEMDPHFWVAHHFLGGVYAVAGPLEEAIASFTRAKSLEPNPEAIACLGYAYGRFGRRSEAMQALEELTDLAKKQYVSPVPFVLLYVGLGQKDEAFAWLEEAFEQRSQWLSEINADPAFDPLRSDPRFADLLRRIGFPARDASG